MKRFLLFMKMTTIAFVLYLFVSTPVKAASELQTIFGDSLEEEGFTKVDVNTPVKVDTTEVKDAKRSYYLFFGGVNSKITGKIFLTPGIQRTNSSVGRKIQTTGTGVGLLFPQVIGVPKDDSKNVIGYSFSNLTSGETGSGFDMATLADSGAIENQLLLKGNTFQDKMTMSYNRALISELYVKQPTNKGADNPNPESGKIVAYGYIKIGTSGSSQLVPARVTGESIDKIGTVRWRFSYKSPFAADKKFATSFGVHMDIQGQHVTSKMFSLGSDKGVYFKQNGDSTDSPFLSDGVPYYLYFYKDPTDSADRDPAKYNEPWRLYLSGYGIGEDTIPRNFLNTYFGNTNVYGEEPAKDIEKDEMFSNTFHPGWMYLWPEKELKPNEIGNFDLLMAVTENQAVTLELNKRDSDGAMIAKDLDETLKVNPVSVDDYHVYQARDLSEFGYNFKRRMVFPLGSKPGDSLQKVIPESDPISIPKEGIEIENGAAFFLKVTNGMADIDVEDQYDINQFSIEEKVNTEKIAPGGVLAFDVIVTPKFQIDLSQTIYNDFQIKTDPLDSSLEGPMNMILTNSKGETVGTATYDSKSRCVIGTVTKNDPVDASEPLTLHYEAKVKNNTVLGTTIMGSATAGGSYDGFVVASYIPMVKTKVVLPAKKQMSNQVNTQVENSEVELVIHFLDDSETPNALAPALTVKGEVGDSVELQSTYPEIKQAVDKIKELDYEVDKVKTGSENYTFVSGENQFTYVFKGIIQLVQAPEKIDFGEISISKYKELKSIGKQVGKNRLIVKDTRSKPESWKITAKVTKPLVNIKDASGQDTLSDALYYQYQKKMLNISSETTVYQSVDHPEKGEVTITDTWINSDTGDGLKFKYDGALPSVSQYEGEITWSLKSTEI